MKNGLLVSWVKKNNRDVFLIPWHAIPPVLSNSLQSFGHTQYTRNKIILVKARKQNVKKKSLPRRLHTPLHVGAVGLPLMRRLLCVFDLRKDGSRCIVALRCN